MRSFDAKTFPNGPGLYSATRTSWVARTSRAPTPTRTPSSGCVTVDGNTLTIKMSGRSRTSPTTRRSRPWARSRPTRRRDPAKYAQHPLSTGPYKIDQYTVGKSLTLVRNDQWDPATDPARTAYPDTYEFKAGLPSDQIDQILLTDSGEAQTTMTYDDVLAQNYRKFNETDRLVTGGSPCTYFYALDHRKMTGQVDPRGADLGRPLQGPDPGHRPDPRGHRGRDPEPHASGHPGP